MLFGVLKVSGHSMEPTIKNGQTVVVSSIPYIIRKPGIGDIVAFKNSDKIFIKRITKIESNNFFIEGDNKDDSLDSRKIGFVKREEILGKVIFNS